MMLWKHFSLQQGLRTLPSLKSGWTNPDGLIGVSDESDEQAEHHIDEEGDEGVKVKSAEKPRHIALVSHLQKSGIHIIAVDEWEKALGDFVECSKLGKINVLLAKVQYLYDISIELICA